MITNRAWHSMGERTVSSCSAASSGDAYSLLKPGGVLAVELFEESLEEARTIALNNGFSEARIVQDLTNRPRILIATK